VKQHFFVAGSAERLNTPLVNS